MNTKDISMKAFVMSLIAALPVLAGAFESGSTGADGAFNPTVNTQVELPASGVLNYTSVNIPAGVTVTFKKNAANTPVVMLVGGNATIAGTIDIRGKSSAHSGTAGDGNQGDDGVPGEGGPGGFDGGRGGTANSSFCSNATQAEKTRGGAGLGPGGGAAGRSFRYSSSYCVTGGGGGGGYGSSGQASFVSRSPSYVSDGGGAFGGGGNSYGSNLIIPLLGGSGGGGGSGGFIHTGSGGGGGGGAILIAASGTVHITGSILAAGGSGGTTAGQGQGGPGAGGAGGAIRIMANTISGNGTLNASGGNRGAVTPNTSGATTSDSIWLNSNIADASAAGNGGTGRIRLEGNNITFSSTTSPAYSKDVPGSVFVAGLPTLTISSVAGAAAPANPAGTADITLPADTQNPLTVTFQTTNVPLGNTVLLTVTPAYGNQIVAQSPAITGTTENGTASVQVSLPKGPSVLQATTTYTIVASLGDALSTYADNERVEKIQLMATLGGPSTTKLITVSGKEFIVPTALLATMGG